MRPPSPSLAGRGLADLLGVAGDGDDEDWEEVAERVDLVRKIAYEAADLSEEDLRRVLELIRRLRKDAGPN